jgi:hypothetical protein
VPGLGFESLSFRGVNGGVVMSWVRIFHLWGQWLPNLKSDRAKIC